MSSIVRQLYTKNLLLKVCQLSNHCNDAVSQYIQVINGIKLLQQESMDCIKFILHGSINRPVQRPEKVPVALTGNHMQKNTIVMNVEIIHCKAEWAARPINCKLINDTLNELIHPKWIHPPPLLVAKACASTCCSLDWHWLPTWGWSSSLKYLPPQNDNVPKIHFPNKGLLLSILRPQSSISIMSDVLTSPLPKV